MKNNTLKRKSTRGIGQNPTTNSGHSRAKFIVGSTAKKEDIIKLSQINLTTKEAIEMRRSIRKLSPQPVPDEVIIELIKSAQLAPSGCNAQPWRYKIVTDPVIKQQLADAAFHQKFIAQAPVVLVCCGDVRNFGEHTVSGLEHLTNIGAIQENHLMGIVQNIVQTLTPESMLVWLNLAINVAIATEHIQLRALDFKLGSCWIGLFQEQEIKKIFNWDDNLFVVSLLVIGYPDEGLVLHPRKNLDLKDVLL